MHICTNVQQIVNFPLKTIQCDISFFCKKNEPFSIYLPFLRREGLRWSWSLGGFTKICVLNKKKNNILWLCFVLKSDLKILFVCLFEIFVWMFCIRFSFEIFLIFLMFCFHWYFDTLCYMCLIFLFDIFVLYFVWDFFFRFWFSLVDISWSNI